MYFVQFTSKFSPFFTFLYFVQFTSKIILRLFLLFGTLYNVNQNYFAPFSTFLYLLECTSKQFCAIFLPGRGVAGWPGRLNNLGHRLLVGALQDADLDRVGFLGRLELVDVELHLVANLEQDDQV